MKQLIVTADDFGLTESVNRGIIEAHRNGIVTSTSLMANGKAFDQAVSMLRDAPELGVGAHLNLTEGIPVSKPTLVRTLVNRDGEMRVGPIGVGKKIATGQLRLGEVELELRAQIGKILAAGVKLTHLDGHKHIQLLPGVFEIAVKLASEFGIKGIRCATEPSGGLRKIFRTRLSGANGLKQFGLGRTLSLFAVRARRGAEQAGLRTPDHFLGIAETGFLDIEQLSRILNNLPEGNSELMSHPGYVDEALRRTPTRLLNQRETELKALTDLKIKELVRENNIALISYGTWLAPIERPSRRTL